ncbi:MAG: transposase [Bacteroidia bacterium]|nr:transposase [Bacteroidia bacterium]
MTDVTEPLIPGEFYHIYNRANGWENLFMNRGNYFFFLQRYHIYVAPVADIYCYCLMPNHFHLLLKMKTEEEMLNKFPDVQDFVEFNSRQFSRCFSSYTQAFNKQHDRMGNLFIKTFKRKGVRDENYFRNVVCYIHKNPMEARMVKSLADWEFSSYKILISDESTFLKKTEVLSYFENKENFIACHENGIHGNDVTI